MQQYKNDLRDEVMVKAKRVEGGRKEIGFKNKTD
jgi:hypothetical protein